MTQKPKTDAQRAAAHVWIRWVVKMLNENGITKHVLLERLATTTVETEWTEESFKADVYKPIYEAVTKKESTEDASTTDHDIVYNGLVKWLGQEFELVAPPFPSNRQ